MTAKPKISGFVIFFVLKLVANLGNVSCVVQLGGVLICCYFLLEIGQLGESAPYLEQILRADLLFPMVVFREGFAAPGFLVCPGEGRVTPEGVCGR